jgi:hypothetical protein
MIDDVDEMLNRVDKHVSEMMKAVNAQIAGMQGSITCIKQNSKDIEERAIELGAHRDSLIGKNGLLVEFTVWNKTGWQIFLEFFGLWKSKRIGMIVTPPWDNRRNFECRIQEPDGTVHEVHVLHLKVINPLDALARGV